MFEQFLNEHYDFRYDEVLDRVFFKKKNETKYRLVADYDLHSILRKLRKRDLNIRKGNLMDLLKSDFVKKYNPFKDYFENLPKWDDEKDYINELASTVKTTNDAYFQWVFKKWLVAMAVSSIKDSIINHTALIFTGEQGTGKTTWLEDRILPKQLQSYMFSGIVNPRNKDTTIQLSECILINMDEIGSFNKRETESFKELITKGIIRERRAYGAFSENYIRRASFVGSSNNNKLLTDMSGNRRFLVVETISFDFEKAIDLDKVYAQAMHLNKDGFKYWFDADDIIRVNNQNEKHREISNEEEMINEYFQLAEEKDADIKYMTATDIAKYINSKTDVTCRQVTIGKILSAKGFRNKKKNGSKKYIVKLKKDK